MKHKFPSTLAAAAVALASQAAGAAAVPTFDVSGRLIGGTGLDVFGQLYDVQFSGGSCASLFGGCADGSSFVISAFDENAAGEAIAQLVGAAYSSGKPQTLSFIAGCSNVLTRCDILTPFGAVDDTTVQVEDTAIFINQSGVGDTLQSTTVESGDSTDAKTTFAIFTAEAAPGSVPEPGSTALVAVGLAAAAASLGKRRAD